MNDSKLILVGHTHKEGPGQFINDFEQWKLEINNSFPSAKDAWEAQAKAVSFYKIKMLAAAEHLKKMKEDLTDLHEFTQEQLAINNKLETELNALKLSTGGATVIEQ